MANFIFDIDGTLRNFEPEPNIDINLLKFLLKIKDEHKLYVVTGKTYKKFSEFNDEFLLDIENGHREDLFDAIFCEDGHIFYESGKKTVLIDKLATEQLKIVKKYLDKHINKTKRRFNFYYPDFLGEVTIILQEEENSLSFKNKLIDYITRHELHLLKVVQLTHNRLSVSVKNVNKKTALEKYGIDFSNSYYFCDEINDLELALQIKTDGGEVICPSNAVSEIKKIASFISKKPYSYGVVDYLSNIFKNSSN